MRALVSLCNVGLFNSQFSLAVVDTASGGVELVDCTGLVNPQRDAGVTGMVRLADGALVLAVQSTRPRLLVLEPDFTVRKVVHDERFSDLHALTARDGFVFVTCTGNNKILKMAEDTFAVTLFWEYPVERPYLHLNALAFDGERPVVASHKLPPECPVGGGTSAGCWRLDDFETVIPDLKQPHTLISDGGALHCLSSNDGRIVTWRDGELSETTLPGYLRGLAPLEDGFLVAASSRRFISRKKDGVHAFTDFSDVIGNPLYTSGLVHTDRGFEPQGRVDTTLAGFEIFEVLPDPGVPEARLRQEIGVLRMQTMQRLLVSVREEAQRAVQQAGAAAMTLYLHIGLHKTGTSSLQAFLRRNRQTLAGLGYVYPEVGWTAGAHHNPAYELLGKKRFDPAAGTLEEMLASIGNAPNAIVSSEEWEFLNVAQCQRLREALGGRSVKVIVYLRRQDALIGSTYAQQVKMGAHLKGFADHVRGALYDSRFDLPQLLGRWAHVFGPENLDAAVITPTIAGAGLYDDFLARIGLAHASAELSRPLRFANESPGWTEVELIRLVTAQLRPGRRMNFPQMKAIGAACAAWLGERPELAVGRVSLSDADYARVAARFGAGNRYAAERFLGGADQADALAFEPRSTPEASPPDFAVLDGAAPHIAARLAAEDPVMVLDA